MDDYSSVLPYLKKKSSGTVAIFKRGESRELFNEDARLVADQLLMSDVGIRKYISDKSELIVLSLNKTQLNRIIRDLLLILNYRVEIYEDTIDNRFQLVAKGDLNDYEDFRDIIESCVELSELATMMAVTISTDLNSDDSFYENKVTAVFCNPHDMRITVAEFRDTPNFYHLSECIQLMSPRQCFLSNKDKEEYSKSFDQLELALRRPNLPYVIFDDIDKSPDDFKSDFLALLFKNWTGYLEPILSSNVLKTAGILITQMKLLPNYENEFLFVNYKAAGHLHLDAAAVKALELFSLVQDDDDQPTRSIGTLYGKLNLCSSDAGKRLLRNWMRRPLYDLRKINERLDVVEALTESNSVRELLSEQLKKIPDIMSIERKLLQRKAKLIDCVRLQRIVEVLSNFDSILTSFYTDNADEEKGAAVKELFLEPVKLCQDQFSEFVEQAEAYVDFDYFEENGEYRIKPDVDEELMNLNDQLNKFEKKAKKLHEAMIKKSGLDSIKLAHHNGFVFRASLKDEKTLNKLGIDIIDIRKATGVTFTDKNLKSLNLEAEEVMQRYNELQEELTQKVINIAVKQAGNLQGLNDLIGLIDVLTAFSKIAVESYRSYVRPVLLESGSGVLELKGCRHPVLEYKDDMEFIPNDIVLKYRTINGKITGQRFAVVTGANMGGKSTYLRSAGLSVLMAQMGCFVPCDSAVISIVDGIHTRVGASDYQCEGISTFMAEMVDCVAILDAAKSTSLVLVDELGRGTSTHDGFGIAWGVANHLLNNIGCFCLFATHYHEMSLLKEKYTEDVINLKVKTIRENGEITFLYKIVEGLAERSFGLNIAQALNYPENIMNDAKKILKYLETNTWDDNIGDLDELEMKENEKIDDETLDQCFEKCKNLLNEKGDKELIRQKILEYTRILE